MTEHHALFGPEKVMRRSPPLQGGDIEVDLPSHAAWSGALTRRVQRGFAVTVFVFFGIFFSRLVILQLVDGEHFRGYAERNRLRNEIVPATRGAIVDRYGEVMAENIPSLALDTVITGVEISRIERESHIVLLESLGISIDTDARSTYIVGDTSLSVLTLAEGITSAQAAAVLSYRDTLLDIQVVTRAQRTVRDDMNFAHVVGYVGKLDSAQWNMVRNESGRYQRNDRIGKTGLEMTYESLLRGIPGRSQVEVDAQGRGAVVIAEESPQEGVLLRTAISASLQRVAVSALNDAVRTYNGTGGAVIVLDPRNGEVLAFASAPQFSANQIAQGNASYVSEVFADTLQPLFNRTLAGQYPIGSTIKPVIAAGALQEGLVTPLTRLHSTGGLRVGDWFFPDWKHGGHGWVDLNQAIAESVNTYFYIVGGGLDDKVGLGAARIVAYARAFGMGESTGIDLPGEKSGFIPTPEWKIEQKKEPWYLGDTYHFAIGQGDVLATPLQVARITAAFANGGYLVTPRLLLDAVPPKLKKISEVRDEVFRDVQRAMRQTVVEGSARALDDIAITVAGKTGTAQAGGNTPNHAWFTGFAPYNNPTIVVTVLIEHGGEGSVAAVPAARVIFSWWATHAH